MDHRAGDHTYKFCFLLFDRFLQPFLILFFTSTFSFSWKNLTRVSLRSTPHICGIHLKLLHNTWKTSEIWINIHLLPARQQYLLSNLLIALPSYALDMLIMNSIIRLYNINSIGDLGLGWYDNSSRCKSYAAHWLAQGAPFCAEHGKIQCSVV